MPKIEIKVTFDPSSKEVRVDGPLDQKGILINMLASAIQIVVNYSPVSNLLVPPENGGAH